MARSHDGGGDGGDDAAKPHADTRSPALTRASLPDGDHALLKGDAMKVLLLLALVALACADELPR